LEAVLPEQAYLGKVSDLIAPMAIMEVKREPTLGPIKIAQSGRESNVFLALKFSAF
jgi:hypothetical protein